MYKNLTKSTPIYKDVNTNRYFGTYEITVSNGWYYRLEEITDKNLLEGREIINSTDIPDIEEVLKEYPYKFIKRKLIKKYGNGEKFSLSYSCFGTLFWDTLDGYWYGLYEDYFSNYTDVEKYFAKRDFIEDTLTGVYILPINQFENLLKDIAEPETFDNINDLYDFINEEKNMIFVALEDKNNSYDNSNKDYDIIFWDDSDNEYTTMGAGPKCMGIPTKLYNGKEIRMYENGM